MLNYTKKIFQKAVIWNEFPKTSALMNVILFLPETRFQQHPSIKTWKLWASCQQNFLFVSGWPETMQSVNLLN